MLLTRLMPRDMEILSEWGQCREMLVWTWPGPGGRAETRWGATTGHRAGLGHWARENVLPHPCPGEDWGLSHNTAKVLSYRGRIRLWPEIFQKENVRPLYLYLGIDNRTLLLRITAKISFQLNSTIVGRSLLPATLWIISKKMKDIWCCIILHVVWSCLNPQRFPDLLKLWMYPVFILYQEKYCYQNWGRLFLENPFMKN